jgi:hypothetical protein
LPFRGTFALAAPYAATKKLAATIQSVARLTEKRPANPMTIRRNSCKKTGHPKIQGVYIERIAFSGHFQLAFSIHSYAMSFGTAAEIDDRYHIRVQFS